MSSVADPGHLESDVPSHVPLELVRRVDFYDGPGMRTDPFGTIARLHDGPRVVWTDYSPRYGHGSWVVTRAQDIRYVLENADLFCSAGWSQNQAITGATWPLVPIELDGARHQAFRALIMPWLTGPSILRLKNAMRQRIDSLLARFVDKGGCEFVADFARPYPVGIFLELFGLPTDDMDQLLEWENNLLHNTDRPTRINAANAIISYLNDASGARRAHPRDDLITRVVHAKIEGASLTDDEVIGLLFTLFMAGLDTVAASLSFHFHYLAVDQLLQRRLRDDTSLIPDAVDEFLRAFSPVNARRRATADTELAGVSIKAGDWITIPYALGSLDPREYERPLDVNIDRKTRRHFAFAVGPHACAGAQLARIELAIALEVWLRAIPTFRLQPGKEIRLHGGGVYGIDHLPLTWDP